MPEQIPPILSHPVVVLAIAFLGSLLKDLVVGVLRQIAKRFLSDKDKGNDELARLLDDAADALDKLRGLPRLK